MAVPEFERLMLKVVPVTVMAFARLKSMPKPVLPVMAWEDVMTGVPLPLKVAMQVAPAWQTGLVRFTPVPL